MTVPTNLNYIIWSWWTTLHNVSSKAILGESYHPNTHTQTHCLIWISNHHHHNRFTVLFQGPPGWDGARRELLDFMVQGKINCRGRHTDHPSGCHSIRTNQCLLPPYPQFLQAGCPSCRPTNSVKAL